MRRFATLLLVAVLLAGCQDRTSLVDPTPYSPGSVIKHAPTNGNPNFFWLQPLAPRASFTGPANLALSPEIRICTAPADLNEEVDACARTAAENGAVAWFTKTASSAGSLITVVDEHYQVDWDTKATPNLTLGKNYRVFALLGGTWIGYLDVFLAENGQDARAAGSDVFGLVDNRALPIRFRLQQGVLASPGACELDCAEFTATNAAFEACTTNNWACLTASDGWLPADFEEVTIVIERVRPAADAAGQCFIEIPLPQGEGCYTVTTHPDLQSAPFQSQVLWNMCRDDGLPDGYEIHQRAGNGEIRRPERAATTSQLDCTRFTVASSIIPDALRRLARPIGQFLFGMPLYAKDSFSAQITSFSKFVYAASVDLQLAGTQTSDRVMTVSFQVISDHGIPDQGTPSGVEGVLVEFEVAAGNGSLDVESAVSAQDGTVQVEWTLPADNGTYELTASIPVLVAPAGEEPTVTVQWTDETACRLCDVQ